MSGPRPRAALYGVEEDMAALRAEAKLRNVRVVAELPRPEGWREAWAMVRAKKVDAIVVQDLSSLGPTLAPILRQLRDLGYHGVAVMTQDGPDLTGLDLRTAADVLCRLVDYREFQDHLASNQKERDQGHAVGRPRFSRVSQIRGGPEIAALLREGRTTRAIAARVGVAPGTVQRVRRMLDRRGK